MCNVPCIFPFLVVKCFTWVRQPTSLFLLFNNSSDGKMLWYWFFTFLSAASQSLQEGLRIDPCTPTGYSYNVESWKFPPSTESEKKHQSIVQTRGNFSECRSAALTLLQKGKGYIYYNFVLFFGLRSRAYLSKLMSC